MRNTPPGRNKNQREMVSPRARWTGWMITCVVCCALVFSAATASAMTIQGEGGLPYFTKGSAVKIEEAASGMKLTVKTADGMVVKTVEVGADGTALVRGLPPGYYEVNEGTQSLAFVITYPRKALPSVVSLDAHISEDWMYKPGMGRQGRVWDSEAIDILNKHLIIARHSGAYYLRERFRWGEFEPEPGQWTDKVYQDFYLPQIEAGFKLLPAIEGLTRWADAIPGQDLGPPRQDAWKTLFATISEKYGETIPLWQVWNEPNPGGIAGKEFPGGSTPITYIDAYARGAREAVDASGKKIKLVLGGCGISDTSWNKTIISEGAMKYMDIFNLHLYGSEPFTFEPLMEELLEALDAVHFSGPIMATEFDVTPGIGIPAPKETGASGKTANVAPDKLAQMYTLWFSLDPRTRAGSLFKFDMRDYLEPDVRMGIARLDFSPKPDLAAMNIIANRLAGAVHLKSIYEGGNPAARLVKHSSGATLIEPVSADPKISMQLIKDSDGRRFATMYGKGECNVATFRTGSTEITLLPATGGNPVKVRTLDGVAVLSLPNERFFYIDGIKDIETCQPIVEVVSGPSAENMVEIGGRECPCMKLSFRNPLSRLIDLKVKVTGNQDLGFPVAGRTLSLEGLANQEMLVPVSLNGSPAAGDQEIFVALDVASYGFHADVPLRVVFSE